MLQEIRSKLNQYRQHHDRADAFAEPDVSILVVESFRQPGRKIQGFEKVPLKMEKRQSLRNNQWTRNSGYKHRWSGFTGHALMQASASGPGANSAIAKQMQLKSEYMQPRSKARE